jgi:hypothetical protein
MRNGCATSVTIEGDVVVVKHVHPREVYCVRVAPLRLTTIELPAGAQMTSAQSGMMEFIELASAEAGGRTTLALQSRCLPLREKDGHIVESSLHRFIDQSSLPFCPRWNSDLVVLTTAGPMYFRLIFNETTRTRLVDVRSEPLAGPARPRVPTRPSDAQDLYARPVDGAVVPWVPDAAWADGYETVLVWNRPMPTLPSLHLGARGEQVGVPTVIHDGRVIAMVYPQRLTAFQLRLGGRKLEFSAKPLST